MLEGARVLVMGARQRPLPLPRRLGDGASYHQYHQVALPVEGGATLGY